MPRKDNSPTISLFSFQDIITSLTGIMFLVVLLLVLLLTDSTSGETQKQVDTKPLVEKLEKVRKLVKEQQDMQAKLRDRVEELKKMDLEHVEQKLDEAKKRFSMLSTELQAKQNQIKIIENLMKYIEKKKKETIRFNKQNERRIVNYSKRIPILKKEVRLYELAEKRHQLLVQYESSANENLQPVLVECGADGIRVLIPKTKEVHDFRIKEDENLYKSVGRFQQWAQGRDPAKEYFVIMAKPVAFGYVPTVEGPLKEAQFQRGYEILPDDNISIFAWEEPEK